MRKNLFTILVIAMVVFFIASLMFTYQVRFTETAVVTHFDQVKEIIEPGSAGLHFKWFWPIDRVYIFDTRLRSFETEFHQAATEDQKTVILTAYATWRITDGKKFLQTVGREDAAASKIKDLLDNQVQLVLRQHPLSALVNVDPKEMKLVDIEKSFLSGIQNSASQKYGIEIVSVGIKRLGLPESVTKDVFARMKEDRQKEIKRLTAEGDTEATKIRSASEEISRKIVARAEAYAKMLEGQGDAEAAKHYAIFEKNPKLSSFLKKLEAVERILQSGQMTLVLDADKFIPFDLLKAAVREVDANGKAQSAAPSNPNQVAQQDSATQGDTSDHGK